jgi:hypothetical protein
MAIIFISLNDEFIKMTTQSGFESQFMKVDDYVSNEPIYYEFS